MHAHVPSKEDEAKVPELIEKVKTLLIEHGMLERTACFSLDTSVNKQLAEVAEFSTLVSAMESVKVMLLYYSGLLPFVSTRKLCSLYGFTLAKLSDLALLDKIPVRAQESKPIVRVCLPEMGTQMCLRNLGCTVFLMLTRAACSAVTDRY